MDSNLRRWPYLIHIRTDLSHDTAEEYRRQVSVYYPVLDAEYPDRDVRVGLFYTADGESVPVEPLSVGKLEDLVHDLRGVLGTR